MELAAASVVAAVETATEVGSQHRAELRQTEDKAMRGSQSELMTRGRMRLRGWEPAGRVEEKTKTGRVSASVLVGLVALVLGGSLDRERLRKEDSAASRLCIRSMRMGSVKLPASVPFSDASVVRSSSVAGKSKRSRSQAGLESLRHNSDT